MTRGIGQVLAVSRKSLHNRQKTPQQIFHSVLDLSFSVPPRFITTFPPSKGDEIIKGSRVGKG